MAFALASCGPWLNAEAGVSQLPHVEAGNMHFRDTMMREV